MERKFILSCCSTVDLPYSYMEQRDIPVLFYTYVVDGQEYVDDMGRDPEALPRFYRFLQEGKLPQTSQINVATYLDFFEQQLQHAGQNQRHRKQQHLRQDGTLRHVHLVAALSNVHENNPFLRSSIR